jgi:hypothetical protein
MQVYSQKKHSLVSRKGYSAFFWLELEPLRIVADAFAIVKQGVNCLGFWLL